jgi:hypothetical protein
MEILAYYIQRDTGHALADAFGNILRDIIAGVREIGQLDAALLDKCAVLPENRPDLIARYIASGANVLVVPA